MKYKYDTNYIINSIEWWMEHEDIPIADVYEMTHKYTDRFIEQIGRGLNRRINDRWRQYMKEIIIPYIEHQYKQWILDTKLRELDSDFQ